MPNGRSKQTSKEGRLTRWPQMFKNAQILSDLITSRQSQAVSEARKLQKLQVTTFSPQYLVAFCQTELAELDKGVSFDIGLLRSRIEDASRTYESARQMHSTLDGIANQRRQKFDRAEKEYVQAKLDLQKAQDLKEQLTEHLMVSSFSISWLNPSLR